MLKNKSKIITVVLLVMTVGLVAAIIYISQIITNEPKVGQANTNLAPQKTKAADVSYQKTVALNNITPTIISQTTLAPISSEQKAKETMAILSPTVIPTINNLLAVNSLTASVSPTLEPTIGGLKLTPTEMILAYNNLTVTPVSGNVYTSSISATTVAKAKTLPDSGFITNSIIMFVAAGLIIFFSFMF